MNIRSHPQWPLIEETGLKKLYMDTTGKRTAPEDMGLIRCTLEPIIGGFHEKYDFLVKEHAVKCLARFTEVLKTGKSPKGMELYTHDMPPVTRRLYWALHQVEL